MKKTQHVLYFRKAEDARISNMTFSPRMSNVKCQMSDVKWRMSNNKTIVICVNSAFTGCFLKIDSYESDDSDASGESCDFGESVFFSYENDDFVESGDSGEAIESVDSSRSGDSSEYGNSDESYDSGDSGESGG